MSTRQRILIVGSDSLIGAALRTELNRRGHDVSGTTRRQVEPTPANDWRFDLAADVEQWPRLPTCDVVVMCAAVNGYAACRANPSLARLVNLTAAVALARWANSFSAHYVFLSSAAVFDGLRPQRLADEPPKPTTVYGSLKAEAEAQIVAAHPDAAIVRPTKIISARDVLWRRWRDELSRGQTIHPFTDLTLAPVPLSLTVQALTEIIERRRGGVWQLSADRDVSYVEAAGWLAEAVAAPPSLIQPRLAAEAGIPSCEAPRFTSLDASRAERELGIAVPAARSVMTTMFIEMLAKDA